MRRLASLNAFAWATLMTRALKPIVVLALAGARQSALQWKTAQRLQSFDLLPLQSFNLLPNLLSQR
jgi:hypothetical protein